MKMRDIINIINEAQEEWPFNHINNVFKRFNVKPNDHNPPIKSRNGKFTYRRAGTTTTPFIGMDQYNDKDKTPWELATVELAGDGPDGVTGTVTLNRISILSDWPNVWIDIDQGSGADIQGDSALKAAVEELLPVGIEIQIVEKNKGYAKDAAQFRLRYTGPSDYLQWVYNLKHNLTGLDGDWDAYDPDALAKKDRDQEEFLAKKAELDKNPPKPKKKPGKTIETETGTATLLRDGSMIVDNSGYKRRLPKETVKQMHAKNMDYFTDPYEDFDTDDPKVDARIMALHKAGRLVTFDGQYWDFHEELHIIPTYREFK